MIETGDLGLLPESEMEARSAGSTPYAIAADAAKNPLRELLDAARAANAGEPASLPRLKELLAHRDPALRWWGATGFVTLGPKAAPAAEALTAALADASAEVRVAAAEALIGLGRTDEAMPALRASLGDTSALVRLAALNVADRLGEAARPLLPAIRAAAPGGGDPPAEYCGRLREQILARLGPPGSAGPNP